MNLSLPEMVRVLGVIPARFGSTRFPGKALAQVGGKPLVQRVWEGASRSRRLDRLVVATDDERIAQAVRGFGGEAVMTTQGLASGTDRIWEAARATPAEIVVNIQGDEPLVAPEMVDALIEALEQDERAEMATLRFSVRTPEEMEDPNVVKVSADVQGWAVNFSRCPMARERSAAWYKHIGLYAWRRGALERFVGWPSSSRERTERLEQLRALERGMRIRVVDSPADSVGVDTPEDVRRVEERLSRE